MPKQYQIIEKPFGICDDPNAFEAPEGALAQAENVVMHKPGVLEPRPGFQPVSISPATLLPFRIVNFDSDLLLIDPYTYDKMVFLGNLSNYLQDEDSGYPTFFDNFYNYVIDRGNLYLGTDDGVRKVTDSDSTDLFLAGVLPDIIPTLVGSSSIGTDWLPDTYSVSYRYTVFRKDSNDVEVESSPTGARWYENDSGSAVDTSHTVYLGSSIRAGDIIRVYRSEVSSSTPFDTHYLAKEITITSSDISTGYIDFNDTADDSSLRTRLYTNEEEEGILQENSIPPVAKCLCQHAGRVLYSNIISPSLVNLVMPNRAGDDLEGIDDQVGIREVSCTITNGSDQVTVVGDATGLQIGQFIRGTGIPSDTYLGNISGSTITMTKDATASGTVPLVFVDTITFGYGSTYETYVLGTSYSASDNTNIRNLLNDISRNDSREYLVDAVQYYYASNQNNALPETSEFYVKRSALNSSIFYVWATNGDEYNPPLSGPTWSGSTFVFSTSTGLASTMTVVPNRMYGSKVGQPEHVPSLDYIDIGSKGAIIQTVSIGSSVLVFKRDGIYLVETSGPVRSWTSRIIDQTTILINSSSAKYIDGYVYAITNKGFVRVNEYGVERLSANLFLSTLLPVYTEAFSSESLKSICVFVEYDPINGDVFFAFPDYVDDEYTYNLYVYNIYTKRFTTWNFPDSIRYIVSNFSNDYELYLAGYNDLAGTTYELWANSYNIKSGNNRRTRTISSKPDSTTINFTAAHNAVVGDIIHEQTSEYWQEILTVVDSDTVTVADNSNLVGGVYIYTPVTSKIQWTPKFGQTEALRKNFVAGGFMFRRLSGGEREYDLDEYYFDWDGSTASDYSDEIEDLTQRYDVDVEHARCIKLQPRIEISVPDREWELTGMFLEYYAQQRRGI